MADIYINPAQGQLSVKIESKSLQVIGYNVQLIDVNRNSISEFDGTLGSSSDNIVHEIGISPKDCIGGFISGVIEIIDPLGAGNNYEVDISVSQSGAQLSPVIQLSGQTTDDEVTRYPTFHVNQIK